MPLNKADYDFLCGNDLKVIKLAINNDSYHTVRVQAESAKHIDLSGGTRNVSEFLLSHCLKLTRIIWPEDTGFIKRIKICSADCLTRLDISTLHNLEELSIVNCDKLTEIIGLGSHLKLLNSHGTTIKTIDTSHCKELEVFNINTLSSGFNVKLDRLHSLKEVFIVTTDDMHLKNKNLACQISHCTNLNAIYLNSGNNPTIINTMDCPNLTDAIILCGNYSEAAGLEESKKLHFLYVKNEVGIQIENSLNSLRLTSNSAEPAQKLESIKSRNLEFIDSLLNPKLEPEEMETMIQKSGTLRERNKAFFIKINLLSKAENEYGYELTKEPIHFIQSTQAVFKMFLDNPAAHIIHLKQLPISPKFNKIFADAKHAKQSDKEIFDWFDNKDTRKPNILLLEKKHLKDPDKRDLIEQLKLENTYITYKDHKRKLQPNDKVVIEEIVRNLTNPISPALYHEFSAGKQKNDRANPQAYQQVAAEAFSAIKTIQRSTNTTKSEILKKIEIIATVAKKISNLTLKIEPHIKINPEIKPFKARQPSNRVVIYFIFIP